MSKVFIKRMLFFDFLGAIVVTEILAAERLKFHLASHGVSLDSYFLIIATIIVSLFMSTTVFLELTKRKYKEILDAKKEMILLSILGGVWLSGIFFLLER